MSPAEAAILIGCAASHVRSLIREGELQATKNTSKTPRGHKVHTYDVTLEEVRRYIAYKPKRGWHRGRPRKTG